jgi:hypoxanthine phosphoribosyltransferase
MEIFLTFLFGAPFQPVYRHSFGVWDEVVPMDEIESFKCRILTWGEIASWTEAVANDIEDDGYTPTVVVGLTSGGWIPARLICDHLKVKKLYAVKTEHWGITANNDGKALLTQELNTNISGERVLIVDDITDTGESLSLAVKHIAELDPSEIRSATLLHIAHSQIEPDYYEVEVPEDDWTWFIFPWNFHEDLRTLLPKILYEPKTVLGIRQGFKDQFQIDVSEEMIRRTLRILRASGKVQKKGAKWVKCD